MTEPTDKASPEIMAISIKPEEFDRITRLISAIYLAARGPEKPKCSLSEFWLALTTLALVTERDLRSSYGEQPREYDFDTLMTGMHAVAHAFVKIHTRDDNADFGDLTPEQIRTLIDLLRADPTDLHQA